MWKIRFLVIGLLCGISFSSVAAEAAPLALDVDFTRVKKNTVVAKGRFDGVLPENWRPDYPGWTGCEATGRVINEGMEHFLRFEVTKMDSQRVQFACPVPRPADRKYYKLSLQYRNLQDNKAEILIRETAAPYRTLWSAPLEITPEWKKAEFIFRPQAGVPAGEVGLFLYLNAVGAFDIVSLKLTEAGPEELAKSASGIRRPSPELKNFFRNSRLPAGLQSGWNFGREKTPQWRISAEPGPSGSPCLVFRDGALLTEPFQVAEPGKVHTFSFSYRGEGEVYAGGRWRKLPAAEEWKRLGIEFIPEAEAKAFQFRLRTRNTLAVDAFRVAAGNDSAYLPQAPCEVALALPPGEAAASRIQFLTEVPRIDYRLSGSWEGAVLAVTAADLYGRKQSFQVTPRNAHGSIDFGMFAGGASGQFRIEVAAVRDGKPISPVNELVVTRLPRPRYWDRDAPDSPFGIHVLANDPVLKSIKAAGVNHVRLHDAGTEYIGWAFLEPSRGEWRFRDDAIGLYRRNHLKILGGLSTAPAWATEAGKREWDKKKLSWLERYRLNYAAPLRPEEFAAYVTAVVRRYRGEIDEYMVWNEPWASGFFYKGFDENGSRISFPDNAPPYFTLQKAAFEAARAVAPEVRIAGYNTVAGVIGERWNRALAKLGAGRYCDIVDFHLYNDRYTGYPGDIPERAIRELRDTIGSGFRQRIYMSEGQGASKSAANEALGEYIGIYRHTVPWPNRDDNLELSELQVRYIVSLLAAGVDRVFLYSAHTYEGLARQPNFLALLQADGYPSPQLAAHAAMARLLEDKKFTARRGFGDQVYAYCFSDGRTSTVVAIPRKTASGWLLRSRLPGVARTDLWGNPYAAGATSGRVLYYLTGDFPAEELLDSLSLDGRPEAAKNR